MAAFAGETRSKSGLAISTVGSPLQAGRATATRRAQIRRIIPEGDACRRPLLCPAGGRTRNGFRARRIFQIVHARVRRLLRILGPGLITGASDDDPSGIATYSQAGARFGTGL